MYIDRERERERYGYVRVYRYRYIHIISLLPLGTMLMPLGTSPPTSSAPAVAPTSIDVLELAEVYI